jgi:transposase
MAAAPDDIALLKAALAAAERRADLAERGRDEAVANAARVKAKVSGAEGDCQEFRV